MAKVVKPDQVQRVRRGRKANIREDLVNLFGNVKPGTVMILDTEFGGKIEPNKKGSVNQTIRKHWSLARPDVAMRITYTTDGFPTVEISESE